MRATIAVAALLLAACAKPEAPQEACHAPSLAQHAPLETYGGRVEAASLCVKRAAFELTRAGGPLEPIAGQAVSRCAAEEAAIAKTGALQDWQIPQMHETLMHTARLTAVQARAIGCGRAPGEPPDTV